MKPRFTILTIVSLLLFGCDEKTYDDIDIPTNFYDLTTLQLMDNSNFFNPYDAIADFSTYQIAYIDYNWNTQLQKNLSTYYLPLNLKSNKATYTFFKDTKSFTLTINYQLTVIDGNIGYQEYYNSKWMAIDTFSIDTAASSPIFNNMYFEQNADFEKDTTAFALVRSRTLK